VEKVKGQARFIHSGAGQVHIGYVARPCIRCFPPSWPPWPESTRHPHILHELTGEDQVAGLHAA